MRKVLMTMALTVGLAWAAAVAARTVEVLDASGRVVATGALSGHLSVRGDLGAARTVRVSTTVNGVTTVRVFTLAGPITARDPEAERLGVSVNGRVLALESAVQAQDTLARGGADDGAGHDAGDDHGGSGGGGKGSGGGRGGGHR